MNSTLDAKVTIELNQYKVLYPCCTTPGQYVTPGYVPHPTFKSHTEYMKWKRLNATLYSNTTPPCYC